MRDEYKKDKPKAYTSFNTRFLITDKNPKLLKMLKKKSLHAASDLYGISRKALRYWIQQKEEIMEVTKN